MMTKSITELAHFNMIHRQIRPWGVLDERVLAVMSKLRRESFVPPAYLGLAYADLEIPLNQKVRMLAPKIVGRLLQALNVRQDDRVLEIGTGSGYLTACLDQLGGRVISLEIDLDLATQARERLATLGYQHSEIRVSDGLLEPIAEAPFNAIAITGALTNESKLPLFEQQLSVGGRLFCVIGQAPLMTAWRFTRHPDLGLQREALFETCIATLKSESTPAAIEFIL